MSTKPKRVIVVENDIILRDLYASQIKQAGLEVKTARSAQESVEILDDWPADLAVLDIGLPGHGGVELLHELQSYDDWQNMPVLAVSSLDAATFDMTPRQWQAYGVVEVIYKPLLTSKILAKKIQTTLAI